jgi:hypothetical protein
MKAISFIFKLGNFVVIFIEEIEQYGDRERPFRCLVSPYGNINLKHFFENKAIFSKLRDPVERSQYIISMWFYKSNTILLTKHVFISI